MIDPDKTNQIIALLCSESGSHDYTIDRREGRDLGLTIEMPDDDLYRLMRDVHKSFRAELQLTEPYDPLAMLGGSPTARYKFRRCLIESIEGGCNSFVSEGTLTMQPANQVADHREFEGWRKLA